MRVLVITGSPRRRGTTAKLAAAFIAGAEDAGHSVERCDAAAMKVGPCKACYYCKKHDGACNQKDDMQPLLGKEGKLLKADAIVFVTPLYYYGMSAQIKLVLDRFYAIGRGMRGLNQKALLIAAAGDDDPNVMDALKLMFQSVCSWAGWRNSGAVLAIACHEPEQLEATDYEAQAYEMGKNL